MQLQRAFTLIEIAVVLVLVGIISAAALTFSDSDNGQACYEKTQAQLATIQGAMHDFSMRNQRLPAPARMDIGSNHGQFGQEVSNTADVVNNGNVLVGALPHATLGLPLSDAADCWNSKLVYAVSATLITTNPTTGYPSKTAGAITVNANNRLSPTAAANRVDYIVLSNGINRMGATPLSASDQPARNCNGASSNVIDQENCDTGNGGNAVFFDAMRTLGDANDAYFDDVVIYAKRNLSCEAGTAVNWSDCAGALGATLSNGSATSVTNTNTGYAGTVTVTCDDGSLTQSGASCTGTSSCPPQSYGWGNCSGTTSAVVAHNAGAIITNTAVNYTGEANVTCNNGAFIANSSTCDATTPCAAQTVNWGGGCSAAYGGAPHGGSSTLGNTASGYNGTVQITCTNGTPTPSSPVCNPAPPADCPATTVSWGGGCTASVGALTDGATSPVTSSASSHSGTATATCSGGTTTASGACNANCGAQSVNWGAGCSAAAPLLVHGGRSSVANSATAYSGAVTLTCSNGNLGQTDPVCTSLNCDAQTINWGSSCSGAVPSLTNGQSASVNNTVEGQTGTVNATCTNGSIGMADETCASAPSGPLWQCTFAWQILNTTNPRLMESRRIRCVRNNGGAIDTGQLRDTGEQRLENRPDELRNTLTVFGRIEGLDPVNMIPDFGSNYSPKCRAPSSPRTAVSGWTSGPTRNPYNMVNVDCEQEQGRARRNIYDQP
ncbi:MAG: hypothetical protein DI582_00660 [Azospirillum brasilense]|nr:MAG: hypothetical protein DI582_00660 [Azospirillum brasilense]